MAVAAATGSRAGSQVAPQTGGSQRKRGVAATAAVAMAVTLLLLVWYSTRWDGALANAHDDGGPLQRRAPNAAAAIGEPSQSGSRAHLSRTGDDDDHDGGGMAATGMPPPRGAGSFREVPTPFAGEERIAANAWEEQDAADGSTSPPLIPIAHPDCGPRPDHTKPVCGDEVTGEEPGRWCPPSDELLEALGLPLPGDHAFFVYVLDGCRLRRWSAQQARECVAHAPLAMVGDSTMRYQYMSLVYFLRYGRYPHPTGGHAADPRVGPSPVNDREWWGWLLQHAPVETFPPLGNDTRLTGYRPLGLNLTEIDMYSMRGRNNGFYPGTAALMGDSEQCDCFRYPGGGEREYRPPDVAGPGTTAKACKWTSCSIENRFFRLDGVPLTRTTRAQLQAQTRSRRRAAMEVGAAGARHPQLGESDEAATATPRPPTGTAAISFFQYWGKRVLAHSGFPPFVSDDGSGTPPLNGLAADEATSRSGYGTQPACVPGACYPPFDHSLELDEALRTLVPELKPRPRVVLVNSGLWSDPHHEWNSDRYSRVFEAGTAAVAGAWSQGLRGTDTVGNGGAGGDGDGRMDSGGDGRIVWKTIHSVETNNRIADSDFRTSAKRMGWELFDANTVTQETTATMQWTLWDGNHHVA